MTMTETRPREYVDAVIGDDGVIVCRCGRFLLKLEDATLLAMLRAHRIRFYAPACKDCKHRGVIDFAMC